MFLQKFLNLKGETCEIIHILGMVFLWSGESSVGGGGGEASIFFKYWQDNHCRGFNF